MLTMTHMVFPYDAFYQTIQLFSNDSFQDTSDNFMPAHIYLSNKCH